LINEIKAFKKVVEGKEVFKFIISSFYDKPYTISWENDNDSFEKAIQKNFISADDETSVSWQNIRMKELSKKLKTLSEISESDSRVEIEEYVSKEGVPFELDNLEFWQRFYF
jgi:hypothetical protein